MPREASCNLCGLCRGVRTVCVWGEGDGSSGVMLVGEAPGEEEDAYGRPFIGAAGKWLDKAISAAGLERETLYITNLVKCRPPGNRNPMPDEAEACFRYLAEEMLEIQPKIVVALGNVPLSKLANRTLISRERGRLLKPAKGVQLGDTMLMASYHPAYIARNPADLPKLVDDLRMAATLAGADTPVAQNLPGHETHYLEPEYSETQLRELLDKLTDIKWVTWDAEWSDLSKKKDDMTWPWTPGADLFCVSFSGRVDAKTIRTVAFPWHDKYWPVVNSFLASHNVVFHNGLSDGVWILAKHMVFRPAGETMGIPYLIDESSPRSLEVLATTKAKVPPSYKHSYVQFKYRPRTPAEWELLLTRCAADTYAGLLLHEAEVEEVKALPPERREGLVRIYTREMLPLIPILAGMTYRGAPMNLDNMRAALETQENHLQEIIREIAALTNTTTDAARAMAGSPDQLKRFLREAYHLNLKNTNKTTLSAIQNAYPLLEKVRDYRHVNDKLIGGSLKPWSQQLAEQRDWVKDYHLPALDYIGWLHSIYGIWTDTGRAQASSEAGVSIHQAGREKWLRELFEAPPGCKIVAADNSMAELRTGSWITGEKHMRQLLNDGVNLHQATAAFISKAFPAGVKTVAEFWPRRAEFMAMVAKGSEEYSRAKPVNFGKAFMQMDEGFINYARNSYNVIFTPEEAHLAHVGYFEMYPGLAEFHEQCKYWFEHQDKAVNEWFRPGGVRTPFDRWRHHFTAATEVCAMPIQSTASELLMLALIAINMEIQERHLRAILFGTVHDSIEAVVHDDDATEVGDVMVRHMTRPPTEWLGVEFESIPVPLEAEVTIGQRWG